LRKRVAIVGIGVIAPNGIGKEAFWEALAEGKSGIKRITSFDPDSFPTQIAGEVCGFDPSNYMCHKEAKFISRSCQFAIAATKMALQDSQLNIEEENEVGIIMGTSISPIDVIETQHTRFMQNTSRVSTFGVKAMVPNAIASNISTFLGCKGVSITISNSCVSGLDALGYAFSLIANGMDNTFISGAADAQITPFGIALLSAPRVLSKRNDDPEKASRPFDKMRDGGVLSEGAGVLILEEMEHATSRNAHIYAEILGYASRADRNGTYEIGIANSGIERTMRLALQNSGIEPEEIDYICAHAPSDGFDRIETIAIKQVFKEHAYNIPVSSIKSMTGNPLSSAGVLQMIASLMVFEKNIIPPTINLECPDLDCDLDYVPQKSRKSDGIKTILVNSHGFGGVNASMIINSRTSKAQRK
jgi:3-oxoacyl-[acyl-carrier-protein] synthase II